MSPYILHCTVCEKDLTTRTKWLRHLLKSEHQKKSREQFFQWDDKVKECVLVVFSSFPVAKCDTILQHFSSSRWMEDEEFVEKERLVIVTDFVWFPERPFVGFLQFESRAKVDSIMRRGSSLEARIDNQLVQLKKAADCMQLEWNQLLPMTNETSHPDPDRTENLVVNGRNSDPKPIMPESSKSEPEQPFNTTGKNNGNRIRNQHESIRREMKITDPQKTFVVALNLESVFSDRYPNVRAIQFRNRHMAISNGIKYTGNNAVLIFLLTKSEYNTSGDGEEVNWTPEDTLNTFEDVFNSPKAINLFGGRVVATEQEIRCGSTFISSIPPLKFNIITDASLLPEVQACRLLKYMIRFDSRAGPLLTLVRFWAKINHVRISCKARKSFEPPETSYFDRLLMFFLCNKKIVPTPRQIQQNPHEHLLLNGVDIGFSEDSRCPDEWKSQNPAAHAKWNASCFSDVLALLLDFFQFLDSEIFGPGFQKVIFNTRDGDIINKTHIFPNSRSRVTPHMSCLTEDEVAIVTSQRRMKAENGYNIFVLHPLYLGYLCQIEVGRRLWTRNKKIISQTRNQLETSFRKCGASGEVELIGDFHLRKILRVKYVPTSVPSKKSS